MTLDVIKSPVIGSGWKAQKPQGLGSPDAQYNGPPLVWSVLGDQTHNNMCAYFCGSKIVPLWHLYTLQVGTLYSTTTWLQQTHSDSSRCWVMALWDTLCVWLSSFTVLTLLDDNVAFVSFVVGSRKVHLLGNQIFNVPIVGLHGDQITSKSFCLSESVFKLNRNKNTYCWKRMLCWGHIPRDVRMLSMSVWMSLP